MHVRRAAELAVGYALVLAALVGCASGPPVRITPGTLAPASPAARTVVAVRPPLLGDLVTTATDSGSMAPALQRSLDRLATQVRRVVITVLPAGQGVAYLKILQCPHHRLMAVRS